MVSMKKLVLAVLLAGIASFVWGVISHEVLPMYKNSLQKFTDEDAVTKAIVANAPTKGVYFMPYVPQNANGMSAEEFKAAQRATIVKLQQGPFVFASVRLGAMSSLAAYLLVQILGDVLTALFLTLILMKALERPYWNRVMTCVWVALAAFAVKSLPMWNWYEFSNAFTVAELIDITGRMLVAGLVIAKILPKGAQEQAV